MAGGGCSRPKAMEPPPAAPTPSTPDEDAHDDEAAPAAAQELQTSRVTEDANSVEKQPSSPSNLSPPSPQPTSLVLEPLPSIDTHHTPKHLKRPLDPNASTSSPADFDATRIVTRHLSPRLLRRVAQFLNIEREEARQLLLSLERHLALHPGSHLLGNPIEYMQRLLVKDVAEGKHARTWWNKGRLESFLEFFCGNVRLRGPSNLSPAMRKDIVARQAGSLAEAFVSRALHARHLMLPPNVQKADSAPSATTTAATTPPDLQHIMRLGAVLASPPRGLADEITRPKIDRTERAVLKDQLRYSVLLLLPDLDAKQAVVFSDVIDADDPGDPIDDAPACSASSSVAAWSEKNGEDRHKAKVPARDVRSEKSLLDWATRYEVVRTRERMTEAWARDQAQLRQFGWLDAPVYDVVRVCIHKRREWDCFCVFLKAHEGLVDGVWPRVDPGHPQPTVKVKGDAANGTNGNLVAPLAASPRFAPPPAIVTINDSTVAAPSPVTPIPNSPPVPAASSIDDIPILASTSEQRSNSSEPIHVDSATQTNGSALVHTPPNGSRSSTAGPPAPAKSKNAGQVTVWTEPLPPPKGPAGKQVNGRLSRTSSRYRPVEEPVTAASAPSVHSVARASPPTTPAPPTAPPAAPAALLSPALAIPNDLLLHNSGRPNLYERLGPDFASIPPPPSTCRCNQCGAVFLLIQLLLGTLAVAAHPEGPPLSSRQAATWTRFCAAQAPAGPWTEVEASAVEIARRTFVALCAAGDEAAEPVAERWLQLGSWAQTMLADAVENWGVALPRDRGVPDKLRQVLLYMASMGPGWGCKSAQGRGGTGELAELEAIERGPLPQEYPQLPRADGLGDVVSAPPPRKKGGKAAARKRMLGKKVNSSARSLAAARAAVAGPSNGGDQVPAQSTPAASPSTASLHIPIAPSNGHQSPAPSETEDEPQLDAIFASLTPAEQAKYLSDTASLAAAVKQREDRWAKKMNQRRAEKEEEAKASAEKEKAGAEGREKAEREERETTEREEKERLERFEEARRQLKEREEAAERQRQQEEEQLRRQRQVAREAERKVSRLQNKSKRRK